MTATIPPSPAPESLSTPESAAPLRPVEQLYKFNEFTTTNPPTIEDLHAVQPLVRNISESTNGDGSSTHTLTHEDGVDILDRDKAAAAKQKAEYQSWVLTDEQADDASAIKDANSISDFNKGLKNSKEVSGEQRTAVFKRRIASYNAFKLSLPQNTPAQEAFAQYKDMAAKRLALSEAIYSYDEEKGGTILGNPNPAPPEQQTDEPKTQPEKQSAAPAPRNDHEDRRKGSDARTSTRGTRTRAPRGKNAADSAQSAYDPIDKNVIDADIVPGPQQENAPVKVETDTDLDRKLEQSAYKLAETMGIDLDAAVARDARAASRRAAAPNADAKPNTDAKKAAADPEHTVDPDAPTQEMTTVPRAKGIWNRAKQLYWNARFYRLTGESVNGPNAKAMAEEGKSHELAKKVALGAFAVGYAGVRIYGLVHGMSGGGSSVVAEHVQEAANNAPKARLLEHVVPTDLAAHDESLKQGETIYGHVAEIAHNHHITDKGQIGRIALEVQHENGLSDYGVRHMAVGQGFHIHDLSKELGGSSTQVVHEAAPAHAVLPGGHVVQAAPQTYWESHPLAEPMFASDILVGAAAANTYAGIRDNHGESEDAADGSSKTRKLKAAGKYTAERIVRPGARRASELGRSALFGAIGSQRLESLLNVPEPEKTSKKSPRGNHPKRGSSPPRNNGGQRKHGKAKTGTK